MTPLTAPEVLAITDAIVAPITANFVMILTILATVAGFGLVYKYVKRSAK